MIGEFHLCNGLYFRREDDGAVSIRLAEDAKPDSETIFSAYIPASSWASVVAHVSANGEDADTYQAALHFHAGRLAPGVLG